MSLAKQLLAALVVGFALVAAQGAAPPTAVCTYCPSYKCFGPCGGQCVCMRDGPQGGKCVSFEALPPGAELIR